MNSCYDCYKRTKKVKKKDKIIWIVSIIVLVAVIGIMLMPLFGVGYFGLIFGHNENKQNYYLVTINCGKEQETAISISQTYRARGGAGLVWENAEDYHSVLSIYFSKEDAQTVADNLLQTNIQTEIINIQIIKPSTKDYNEEEKKIFEKAYTFTLNIITELDKLILQLEKNEITEMSANLTLTNLTLSADYYNQRLIEQEKLKSLNNVMANITSILSYIANEEVLLDTFLPYQAEIRRALIRIVLVMNESL